MKDWLLPIMTLIIVIIFTSVLLILVRSELFPVSLTDKCKPGTCVTNIYNGDKDCINLVYDKSYQTCNDIDSCTSSDTPCLYYDTTIGTVCPGEKRYIDNGGICPKNSPLGCKCSALKYCPIYSTVYFEEVSIPNPASSVGTFKVYLQKTTWTDMLHFPHDRQPLSPGLAKSVVPSACGLKDTSNVWPPLSQEHQDCILGKLTLYSLDNLWYCTNVPKNLSCPRYPVLDPDGTYRCH
jgi:hypothetical protein